MNTMSEVSLDKRLGMEQVNGLYQILAELLQVESNDKADVIINGIGVESISTAAIQCLLAFKKEMNSIGCEVRWSGASYYLHDAVDILGLSDVLGM